MALVSSKGKNASTQRHNNDSIELGVKTVAQSLWALNARSISTGTEGSYLLTEVTDSDSWDLIWLLFHNIGKEDCVWSIGALS